MIPTRETITVESPAEYDDWGRPLEPTTKQYSCRVDYKTEIVKNDNGEDVVSRATILIKGFAPVKLEDTLKWVDAYGEHVTKPISVSPLKDLGSNVILTKVVV